MSNYKYRRDHRTDKEFKQDITNAEKKELFLANRWHLEMLLRGHKIYIEPWGLSIGKINKEIQLGIPDFKFWLKGLTNKKTPLEVKNAPLPDFFTLKIGEFKSIIKYQSYTLLFIGTGQKDIDFTNATWSLITPHIMQQIYEQNQDKSFRHPRFGNKKVIRIKSVNFDNYLIRNKFLFESI